MSQTNDFKEQKFEEANSRLSESLKLCRSIVNNYRAMIAREQNSGGPKGWSRRPQIGD